MKRSIATPWSALSLALLITGAIATPALAAPRAAGTSAQLDVAEASGLIFMREEEKLARDVYARFYPLWNASLFANISSSEQEHFAAVGALLDRYRLDDPARQDMPGVFENPELQALYHQLVAQGGDTLLAALRVGALIEETDMIDLAEAIAATDQPDIVRVYENLLRGSRNHLRAFANAIEAQGVPYTAQLLTQEQVDAIVDSPMERGGR